MSSSLLRVTGEVVADINLTVADFRKIPAKFQVSDFSRLVPSRKGTAVAFEGLLQLVSPTSSAKFLSLHSSTDNFHASIPLGPLSGRAYVIYELAGQGLTLKDGGPFRFFIPDHAACQMHDIDECANVKFVDHIEFTREKGFDNRPTDEEEHAKLHKNG